MSSSTGRGGKRRKGDAYMTPRYVGDALVARLGSLKGKTILEPSAGDGSLVVSLLGAGPFFGAITAIEPNAKRAALCANLGVDVFQCTFERWAKDPEHAHKRFDLIPMNPPYFSAVKHVELAISRLAPGGLCAAFLRLGFGLTKKRREFRSKHPFDKLELASRPSFTGTGSDSTDYAWFLFGTRPDGSPCGGRFEVIEEGPV